jgi:hypothetical protein
MAMTILEEEKIIWSNCMFKYRPQTFNDVENNSYFLNAMFQSHPIIAFGLEELENNLRSYFG